MTGAPAGPPRLRVVTWNIRAAIGPGEPFPPAWWRHVSTARLERIAAILVELDADVVMLQEVTIMTPDGVVHDQPAELGRLTGRPFRYAAAHAYPLVDPATGGTIGSAMWGNAILSRAPLDDGFAFGLPRPADDDLVERRGVDHPLAGTRYRDTESGHREPRCLVGGRFAGVTVATTHLTYIGTAQRGSQARAIAAHLAGDGPLVLGGDFNTAIDAAEVDAVREIAGDAFAAMGIGVDEPRRASFRGTSIDHVLVRGVTVEACRVATEAGDASDHWPVVADLRVD